MGFAKLLVAAVVAVLLPCSAGAAEKLRVGTEAAFPPFEQLQPDGSLTGFDMDIVRALCKKLAADCEIIPADFDGLIPSLHAKKFDLLISSISITDERKKAVDFTDPYYTNRLQFVAPKDVDFKTDKASLQGKTIGVQRATISSTWLEDHVGDAVSVKQYDTQENVFLDLASGRIDAMLGDIFPSLEWLKSSAGKDFELKGKPVYQDDKIGIAVRKGSPLKDRLNKALKDIIADGTYKKINDRYFSMDIY